MFKVIGFCIMFIGVLVFISMSYLGVYIIVQGIVDLILQIKATNPDVDKLFWAVLRIFPLGQLAITAGIWLFAGFFGLGVKVWDYRISKY